MQPSPFNGSVRKRRVAALPAEATSQPVGPWRLENGISVGGAWKVQAMREAVKDAHLMSLQDSLAQASERLGLAEEDRFTTRLALHEEREHGNTARAELKAVMRHMLDTAAEHAALAERCAAAEAAATTAADEHGEMRERLAAAAADSGDLRRQLRGAEGRIGRLESSLRDEQKRSSMLQTLRDQKDRYIVLLIKEKNRLSDQIVAAIKQSKGTRGHTALRKLLEGEDGDGSSGRIVAGPRPASAAALAAATTAAVASGAGTERAGVSSGGSIRPPLQRVWCQAQADSTSATAIALAAVTARSTEGGIDSCWGQPDDDDNGRVGAGAASGHVGSSGGKQGRASCSEGGNDSCSGDGGSDKGNRPRRMPGPAGASGDGGKMRSVAAATAHDGTDTAAATNAMALAMIRRLQRERQAEREEKEALAASLRAERENVAGLRARLDNLRGG
ncbi:unnamed protein product, partial [Phaeothamnion confervicola]